MKTIKDADTADKLFILYIFLYAFIFLSVGWMWYVGEPKEFVTPEGQEVIDKQQESGPF